MSERGGWGRGDSSHKWFYGFMGSWLYVVMLCLLLWLHVFMCFHAFMVLGFCGFLVLRFRASGLHGFMVQNTPNLQFMFFPNSEILFDFNEGSSGVFKDRLMF